ncbi:MAG: cytochrome C oxidase subunit IV family protein [Phycisphaerae bacterium]
MTTASAEDIRKHLKVYYMVFGALAVLTCVTVAVSYLHLTIGMAVLVALAIASVKGSLVACYFMHLLTERGLLLWVLGLCGVFLVVILLLPVLTVTDSVAVP